MVTNVAELPADRGRLHGLRGLADPEEPPPHLRPGAARRVRDRACSPPASRSRYQGHNLAAIGLLARRSASSSSTCCGRRSTRSSARSSSRGGRASSPSLQVGLLGTVLQTLSLRDKMTARHSAAVARYSREIARELGLLGARAGRRAHRRAAARHRQVHLPRLDPVRRHEAHRRRSSRSSAGTRSRAPGSWRGSRATARSPRSSSPTTSGSTATAIRTGCRRADPARRAHHLGRRHLRRDDVARLLPRARSRRARRSRSCGASRTSSSTRRVVETFIGLLETALRHVPARGRRRLRARAQPRAPRTRLRRAAGRRRVDACSMESSRPAADTETTTTTGATAPVVSEYLLDDLALQPIFRAPFSLPPVLQHPGRARRCGLDEQEGTGPGGCP